ncbi:MAG: hypothetical protein RIR69_81 [Actinomycetota bacterium]
MAISQFIWILIVVFVASFAQSISGFGFALLAVPMMSLAANPRDAVVIATFIGAMSSTTQAFLDREHVSWSLVKRLTVSAYVGMPFGLFVFLVVNERFLRFLVGVVVLVATIVLIRGFSMVATHQDTLKWWDRILGWLSGVLATSTSTNGPPLVFLLQARNLEASVFRATISVVFSLTSIGAIVLFVASGEVTSDGVTGVLFSLAALVIGLRMGYYARPRVSAASFRTFVFGLLFLASFSALASATLG